MRKLKGGVAHVASVIEEDLFGRNTGLQKPHIAGLADLSASALTTRSANTAEWSSVIPRKECNDKSKERYISRFLSNSMISPDKVMHGFMSEVIEMIAQNDKTVVLMLDQSKISNGFECLMVSLRLSERAIPIMWKVVKTDGAIGFDVQKDCLDTVRKMIPDGTKIMLTADRFYGTSALINWCKIQGWQYRIRLKGNLIFEHDGGEINCNDAFAMGMTSLENVTFNDTKISTNIGILYEEDGHKKHKEPWFIAMDCKPSKYRILDYSMRWGIECMFSDFKSRGFGITKTQLKDADRIERLILVLTIALYWAVSTGMKPKNIKQTKKNFTVH